MLGIGYNTTSTYYKLANNLLGVSTLLTIIYPRQVLPRKCLSFYLRKQKQGNALEDVRFGYRRAVEEGLNADVRNFKTGLVLQE